MAGAPRKKTTQALAKKNKVDFKSQTMTEILQDILNLPSIPQSVTQLLHHLKIKTKPKNIRDALNLVAVAQALNGSFSHYKEIFDRIDGKQLPVIEESDDEISLIFRIKKPTQRAQKRKTAVANTLAEKDVTPKTIEVKAKSVGRPKKTKRKLGGNK